METYNNNKIDNQKSLADSIDIDKLVESLKEDQLIIDSIANRNLILLLGGSSAGKTTLACSLAGEAMVTKIISNLVAENDCKDASSKTSEENEDFGMEVVDTKESLKGFKIGHDQESCTKSIHVREILQKSVKSNEDPVSNNLWIADSCGFEDTEGPAVDIANAVALRNAMMLCASVRPVIVIDARIGRGVQLTKILKLISRFFSPIDRYLPCLSFFFTRGASNLTDAKVKSALAGLLKAPHISNNSEMKIIVNGMFNFVKDHRDLPIVKIYDIAPLRPENI